MAMPPEPQEDGAEVDPELAQSDIKGGLNAWPERASMPPSGRSLSLHKATLSDPEMKKKPGECDQEADFADMLTKVTNLPAKHGFVPQ